MTTVDHSAYIKNGFAETARTAGSSAPSTGATPKSDSASDSEGGGFIDFLKGVIDIVNPLQHIPIVSTLYRNVTGDEMSPMARLAGDTLFGGPIGAALAMLDIATEGATGKDVGDTMLAALTDDNDSASGTQVASADTTSSTKQNFQTSPAPTTHRTGTSMAMNGNELASRSYKASTAPVSTGENATAVPASGADDSRHSQDGIAGIFSQSQNAPAAGGRKPSAPELIASADMKRGLDHYRANTVRTSQRMPHINTLG